MHAFAVTAAASLRRVNRSRALLAGALSGAAAGIVMSAGMMAYMVAGGRSVWTMPNLIAAMWLGNRVANGVFSSATIVGFATHMMTSVLMGVVAVPFISGLPRWRTILASLSYALASYPLVFAGVLSWANPLMVERAGLVPMTVGHAVFGLVMGMLFYAFR